MNCLICHRLRVKKRMKTYLNKLILGLLCLWFVIVPTSANENPKYACYKIDNYDYSLPVSQSEEVDDSYFDDALFIGDSRMGGFSLYSEIENREVYFIESLFINKLDITVLEDGDTLFDKIEKTDKNNLYLMFGLNESGWKDFTLFTNSLEELILKIRGIHPSMNIYIFLLYTPQKTVAYDSEQIVDVVINDNIEIMKMAYRNNVFVLDMNPYLVGEDNLIRDEYTHDGVHLNKNGVKVMDEFVKTHVAKENTYVKEICN